MVQPFKLLNCKFRFNFSYRALHFFLCWFCGVQVSFLKLFVDSKVKPFSVYLLLSIITTPLPLSCFIKITSLLLMRLLMTFFWCFGTLTLQYFSNEFLSLVLIYLSPFSRILETSFKTFWKTCSSSVETAFLLAFVGIWWFNPYDRALSSSWENAWDEKLCTIFLTNSFCVVDLLYFCWLFRNFIISSCEVILLI